MLRLKEYQLHLCAHALHDSGIETITGEMFQTYPFALVEMLAHMLVDDLLDMLRRERLFFDKYNEEQ